MAQKQKRFGEILIEAGIVNKTQLKEVLNLQKAYPYRTFGEIVSTTYGIPMETIETIFVKHTLIPSIKSILVEQLKKEETKFQSNVPIGVDQLVYDIAIDTIVLKRTVCASFNLVENGELALKPAERSLSTEISGTLKITIQSKNGELVSQEDKQTFQYRSDTGKAALTGCLIDGIKFQYSRKNKEMMGEKIIFNPVTEQELRHVLEQL